MGAHSSCFIGLVTTQQGRRNRALPDDYSLGDELGRGSFSIVYSCTSKSSGEEYAVKRAFKDKNDLESIGQEVGLLRKLDHPSMVRLHGVYCNSHVVDMVFSIYHGGDLIDGMQAHWSSKGDVPIAVVQGLSRQMFQSIDWLHRNGVVHRDVKGENFLLDHPNLAHPDCRVCLSDFGIAREVKPGERLQDFCGSMEYMAPEIFARNYSFKVDVWATGVTTYALATASFPFNTQMEVRTKTVEVPSRCGEACRSFLLGALTKSESVRLSASEALQHSFHAPKDELLAGVPPEATIEPQEKQVIRSGSKEEQALGRSASFYASDAMTALPSESSCVSLLPSGSSCETLSPSGSSCDEY